MNVKTDLFLEKLVDVVKTRKWSNLFEYTRLVLEPWVEWNTKKSMLMPAQLDDYDGYEDGKVFWYQLCWICFTKKRKTSPYPTHIT